MSFLRLFNQFVLRALLREKGRSIVAVVGVAMGVAVMIAIRLANMSVTDTFRAAADSVGGNTSLRIRGQAGPFDEQLFAKLGGVRDFAHLSPVIETYAMVSVEDAPTKGSARFPRGELLHVLGVDVLLDYPLRDYEVVRIGGDGRQSAREVLQLLKDSNSVILTEKFLRKHRLRVGDQIALTFDSRTQNFTIRGVLLNRGPAQTLDGNFALMDIAAAQWAANRLGLLDHVDVLLNEGVDPEAALPAIRAILPEGLIAELPDAGAARTDTMIAAFQFNLAALSAVALIVGLFLIYNTIAMSVASRRAEIGMLQAIGAGRRTVLGLFLAEALLLAVLGLAIGLPLGRLLGQSAVVATAQTVETFYIAAVAESSASSLRLTWRDVVAAALLVVPLTVLAALVPAWEAASVQPIEVVRGLGRRFSGRAMLRVALGGCVCLLLGWALTFGKPIGGIPVLGFSAEIVFMIGGALFTPLLLQLACAAVRSLLTPLLPRARAEIRLAAANLEGQLSRASISVAALGISLSMMIAIAVMVGSFRETVVYWLDSALSADLSIKPVAQTSAVSETRLSPKILEVVERQPEVVDTSWFGSRQIAYRDRNIRLGATDISKTFKHKRLIFKSPPPVADSSPSLVPSVFVSESFSLLFDAPAGSSIVLPTAKGETSFQVAAVYFDYASNQGTVLMDAEVYRRQFGEHDPGLTAQSLAVYLDPAADLEQVRGRILAELGDNERIYCVTSREVRAEALKIFESTFAVTYALQFIAIIVAGLGVASTLLTLVYQRQKEIGLLCLVGASQQQVRRMIVLEAIILGAVSQVIGILTGMLLALVLIYVINVQSFGWTIQIHFPWMFVAQSSILVLTAAGLFGWYPAVLAAGVDALQTVREEHA